MNKIIKIDTKSHVIFLRENLFCVYARIHWREIKEALSIYSYRTAKTTVQYPRNYIFAYEKEYLLCKIEKSSVYFIESIAESHRCKVISQLGVHELKGDLSVLEKELTGNFLKCRRNYIVNMNYVVHVNEKEKHLQLQEGFSCTYELVREKEIIRYLKKDNNFLYF